MVEVTKNSNSCWKSTPSTKSRPSPKTSTPNSATDGWAFAGWAQKVDDFMKKHQSSTILKCFYLLAVPDQGGADVPDSLELLLALHRHLHWDLVVHWTDCTGVQPGDRLRVLASYLHHRSRGWSQRVRIAESQSHIFQSYSICICSLQKRSSFAMTRLTPWIRLKRLSGASCTFNTIFTCREAARSSRTVGRKEKKETYGFLVIETSVYCVFWYVSILFWTLKSITIF